MTKAENSRVARIEPSADRIAADLANTSPGAGNERASTLLGGGVTPASSFRSLLSSLFNARNQSTRECEAPFAIGGGADFISNHDHGGKL